MRNLFGQAQDRSMGNLQAFGRPPATIPGNCAKQSLSCRYGILTFHDEWAKKIAVRSVNVSPMFSEVTRREFGMNKNRRSFLRRGLMMLAAVPAVAAVVGAGAKAEARCRRRRRCGKCC